MKDKISIRTEELLDLLRQKEEFVKLQTYLLNTPFEESLDSINLQFSKLIKKVVRKIVQ